MNFRKLSAALLLAVCCIAVQGQGQEKAFALSGAEQAWVRAHPVLKLGLRQNRPLTRRLPSNRHPLSNQRQARNDID